MKKTRKSKFSIQPKSRIAALSVFRRDHWMDCKGPGFLAVVWSYVLAPSPLPPPSPARKLDWRNRGRLRKRDNLLTGARCGEGRRKVPNHATARPAWSSIIRWILSGFWSLLTWGKCPNCPECPLNPKPPSPYTTGIQFFRHAFLNAVILRVVRVSLSDIWSVRYQNE